jgi:hypothetical protein
MGGALQKRVLRRLTGSVFDYAPAMGMATPAAAGNLLCPAYNLECQFDVVMAELACIKLTVCVLGSKKPHAQAVLPVRSLKTGRCRIFVLCHVSLAQHASMAQVPC